MPSQIITIVKIAGEAGRRVAVDFRRWLAKRKTKNPREFEPAPWPASTRRQIDSLVNRIRDHRTQPPVVYHSEHVDLWSGFDLFIALGTAERVPSVMGDRFELYMPVVKRPKDWVKRTNRALERLANTHQQETCWALRRMLECLDAWGPLVPGATILVVREVVAGLVTDEELTASLDDFPDWLER